MSLRQTTVMLAGTIALAAPASAQMTQTTIKVDGKDYIVTEMTTGRPSPMGHMVQLSGSDGTAMVRVDNNNKIAIYVSPPGGGAYKALIDQVWAAYLEKKAATAPAAPAPVPASSDANAVLRQQAATIAAQAQGRGNDMTNPASDQRVVKSIGDATVVIFDPKLGTDVTVADNLMRATYTITPKVPQGMPVSAKPEIFEISFQGGEKEAGSGTKTLKALKSTGVAIADAGNRSANAVSTVTSSTDTWMVKEKIGRTTQIVFESSGMRLGYAEAGPGEEILWATRAKAYWSL